MDVIDRQIVNLLQENSKITNKAIALNLSLSTTAIYERIRKLEQQGVIKNYVALIDGAMVDRSFLVFCQIKLVQHKHDYVIHFEKEVVKFDEVVECFNVSGEYDYILKILVKDMQAYRDFLNDKLTTLKYISSTHSSFTIHKLKQSHQIRV